jgi:hypothetical protein
MTDAEFEVYITNLELTQARVYKEAHDRLRALSVRVPCGVCTELHSPSGDKRATSIDTTVVAPAGFTSKLTERSEWNLHREIRECYRLPTQTTGVVASAVDNDSASEHEFPCCGEIPSSDSEFESVRAFCEQHPEANEPSTPPTAVHVSWLSLMLCPLAVNSSGVMNICGKCITALTQKEPRMPKGAIADLNFSGVMSQIPELARLTHAEKSLLSKVSLVVL